MNKNKIDLKRQNGSLWHLVRMSFVIVCCFVITSCFPGDQSQQSGSVEEFMRQQQSTAVSYSRSFQNYSALSQQALAKEVWDTGVVALPANGLIDMSQFGAQYNVGNSDGYLQSAYCDNGGGDEYHLTWFKGANDPDTGAMEPMDLKGLGTTGYSAILKTLAKEMSPSAYGTYDNQNQVLSPIKGTQIAMNCPAAQFIPVGAPVIFTPIEQVNFRGNEEYYEYQDIACADPDDIGKIRQRRVVARIMDANGNVISEESKGWEDFISTCQAEPSVPSISADVSGTASVVNFAGSELGITEEPCFTAEIIRENNGDNRPPGLGEPGNGNDSQTIETISNCDDVVGSIELPPGQSLVCGSTAIRTENQAVPCSGSNWGGTAEYEQEIYECEIYQDGVPTGNFYERRMEWALSSVNCTRPETTYFDCPTGAGQFTYTRTNTITNPVLPLTPDNPDWNYSSGRCTDPVLGIVYTSPCHERYVGNDQVIPATLSGTFEDRDRTNPYLYAEYPKENISTVCGTGTQCKEIRPDSCPYVNMTGSENQERTYSCTGEDTGNWSGWSLGASTCTCSGPATISYSQPCAGGLLGSIDVTQNQNPMTCNYGAPVAVNNCYECSGSTNIEETEDCSTLSSAYASGTATRQQIRTCSGGFWDGPAEYTDWDESACVAAGCTEDGTPYDETISCVERDPNLYDGGTATREVALVCTDGSLTPVPGAWDETACSPIDACDPTPVYFWMPDVAVACHASELPAASSGAMGSCTNANAGEVFYGSSWKEDANHTGGICYAGGGIGGTGPAVQASWMQMSWTCTSGNPCDCTNGESEQKSETAACDAGYTGIKQKTDTRTCVGGRWSAWQDGIWNTSSCTACTNQDVWTPIGGSGSGVPLCAGNTWPRGTSCSSGDVCRVDDPEPGVPDFVFSCESRCVP